MPKPEETASRGTRGWGALLACMTMALGGCVSGPAPLDAGDATPPSGWPMPLGPCVADRATTGFSASLDPFYFLEDGMPREELDTAVVGNRTILAASYAAADSMEFYDITDPGHPALVAQWAPGNDFNDDVKFLPGGTGIIIVGRENLRVVDLRNLQNIEIESTFVLDTPPTGLFERGHTIQAWQVDGATYASMGKAEGLDVTIFRVEGEPGGRSLTRVANLASSPLVVAHGVEPLQAHDTWFEVDADTGTPMLWVANVDWGVVGYDVSDPTNPQVVATMLPGPANPLIGYSHSIGVAHVDGRRLVVVAQEYEGGALKVWDASDLGAPRLIGTFSDNRWASFHNMQVVGRFVLATHFEFGLFIFDLAEVPTTDAAMAMPVFAHADAAGDLSNPVAQVPINRARPYLGTFEVVVRDGILWTIEVNTGIRGFTFGCMTPGDPMWTSTG